MCKNVEVQNIEHVVKHLEMAQGVVNRLANNSSTTKNWCMTITVFMLAYQVNTGNELVGYQKALPLVPIIAFWALDAYYLWQERIFRGIYDEVRKKENTDFKMNVPGNMDRLDLCSLIGGVFTLGHCKYNGSKNFWYSYFSITLVLFYGFQIVILFILNFNKIKGLFNG